MSYKMRLKGILIYTVDSKARLNKVRPVLNKDKTRFLTPLKNL